MPSEDRCKIVDQNDISSIDPINRPHMEKNLKRIHMMSSLNTMKRKGTDYDLKRSRANKSKSDSGKKSQKNKNI